MSEDRTEKLRKKFEQLSSCSHGFTRSAKGVYTNPTTARDWKWFQLGAGAILEKDTPEVIKGPNETHDDCILFHELLNYDNWINNTIVHRPFPKLKMTRALTARAISAGDQDLDICLSLLVENILKLPSGTLFSCHSMIRFNTRTEAQKFGKLFSKYAETSQDFQFVSSYPGKAVYKRLDTNRAKTQPNDCVFLNHY